MKKGNKTYQINGEDGPTSVFILKNTKIALLNNNFIKSNTIARRDVLKK